MSRMILCFVVAGVFASQQALAQTPFIENYVHQFTSDRSAPGTWGDIDDTAKAVTVPAGTAFITWSAQSFNGNTKVRPAVGDGNVPAEDIWWLDAGGEHNNVASSWVTTVEAGEINVRLQAEGSGQFLNQSGVTWTLMVFPSESVPAMGSTSWAIMALFILAVGGFILRKQKGFPVDNRGG